jgi:hypothetical protein
MGALEPLPDDVWKGVCFAHSWEDGGARGYGTEASAEALDHLQGLGVGWISLTPFGFMTSVSSTQIRGEHLPDADLPSGAERSRKVVEVARQARERGIKSVLKPHIWIRGGEWRGRIVPENESGAVDWESWWSSYEKWIVFWARVAAEAKIESFVVGVELHTALQNDAGRFIEIIEKVRNVFDGEVHYAGNWNEPVPDEIWLALDAVGVQFYPPLADTFEVPLPEIRRTMKRYLAEWSDVAERNDRPLILTEVGYRSAVSAASHPNAWPERTRGKYAKPDARLQHDLYHILMAELGSLPRLKGVFVWKYFTDRDTDEEGPEGFSLRGKPAETVLGAAYGGQ